MSATSETVPPSDGPKEERATSFSLDVERQTVAIARSMLGEPRMVILDEPTAALGVAQTEQVLNLVRRLADRGLAVVLISHNMNDVLQVADDIAVLYLGKMTAQVEAKDVNHSDVVKLITGGSLVEEGGHVAIADAHDPDDDDPLASGGTGAPA